MSNPYFQFKQFNIWHDKCAMKVGTDSVLLGAWIRASGNLRILDIGTGTGILALMLAQKTTGKIDAVEIETDAYLQACSNVELSHWSDRVQVINESFQEFYNHTRGKYDLIITNPPFYENKIKAPDGKRAVARHSDSLPLDILISLTKNLLKENGRFALVLPYENRLALISEITKNKMWIEREMLIRSIHSKPPVRVMFEISRNLPAINKTEELVIKNSNSLGYSDDFINLTRHYYLNF